MMEAFGKVLVGTGLFIVLFGLTLWFGGKYLQFLGRLPGDISYRSNGFALFIPITTSILLSLVLTLVFTLLALALGRRS
jgi:hypothetical protein